MPRLTWTVPLLVASTLSLAGCATTGQAWVQQPEDALAPVNSPELERITVADRESQVSSAVAEPSVTQPGDPPRHRLDHVVSLGEGAPSGAAPGESAGVASGPTPVVVNIVNYATPPGYGYGPSYSTPSYPVYRTTVAGATHLAPVSAAPQGTPPLAHDWQAPRSFGPNFPYHTGPASPWERTR